MQMLEAIATSSTKLFVGLLQNDKTGGNAKLELENGEGEVLVVDIRIELSSRKAEEGDDNG